MNFPFSSVPHISRRLRILVSLITISGFLTIGYFYNKLAHKEAERVETTIQPITYKGDAYVLNKQYQDKLEEVKYYSELYINMQLVLSGDELLLHKKRLVVAVAELNNIVYQYNLLPNKPINCPTQLYYYNLTDEMWMKGARI